MIKPPKLQQGDKVAAISLSWGGAGTFPHRYKLGKQRLQQIFGLEVIETPHALKPADWIYKNPKARAEDLMWAFEDNSVKAIISIIGGEDSLRTLPYVNLETIRNHPKIFLGFSDTTVTHFACYKAGLVSFYGTSIMAGFAENGAMFDYEIRSLKKTLFENVPVGEISPNTAGWTSEFLDWADPANLTVRRKLEACDTWQFLQGTGKVSGKLLGGCAEVLEFLKGTDFWPPKEEWQDKILFLETSEEKLPTQQFKRILWNYALQGIFHRVKGIILGRPYDNAFTEEYEKILLEVIQEDVRLIDLPIVSRLDFGHTSPAFVLPFGVELEIDCSNKKIYLTESGVS